jgi:hypothetical protein
VLTGRSLRLAPWLDERARWPATGRVLLAQHDDEELVVYQAFSDAIADAALEKQRLDVPGFGLHRMSWVKPSFLWMMYRSRWATKDTNQRRVLAIWLERAALEALLARATVTPFQAEMHGDEESWRQAIALTDVRVQWDPDRTPRGGVDRARRAIQVGLSGEALRTYAAGLIREIQDATPLVVEQRANVERPERLLVPEQSVMSLRNPISRECAEVDA